MNPKLLFIHLLLQSLQKWHCKVGACRTYSKSNKICNSAQSRHLLTLSFIMFAFCVSYAWVTVRWKEMNSFYARCKSRYINLLIIATQFKYCLIEINCMFTFLLSNFCSSILIKWFCSCQSSVPLVITDCCFITDKRSPIQLRSVCYEFITTNSLHKLPGGREKKGMHSFCGLS